MQLSILFDVDTTGCFGGKSNKKAKQDKKGQNNNPPLQTYQR